jgi:hypothetical protein
MRLVSSLLYAPVSTGEGLCERIDEVISDGVSDMEGSSGDKEKL